MQPGECWTVQKNGTERRYYFTNYSLFHCILHGKSVSDLTCKKLDTTQNYTNIFFRCGPTNLQSQISALKQLLLHLTSLDRKYIFVTKTTMFGQKFQALPNLNRKIGTRLHKAQISSVAVVKAVSTRTYADEIRGRLHCESMATSSLPGADDEAASPPVSSATIGLMTGNTWSARPNSSTRRVCCRHARS